MPSKTIVDFANQIKTYMRGAEVVASKNLLDNKATTTEENGITFTVHTDKSVTLNGTSTTGFEYYLTPNNGSDDIIPQGEDYVLSAGITLPEKIFLSLKVGETGVSVEPTESYKQFTASSNVNSVCLIIRNNTTFNNLRVYPMICTLAEWTRSNTYMPYYVPVKDSKLDIADQQVLGAWNLWNITGETTTNNDITYTVNSDKSVTLNGTASANSTFDLTSISNEKIMSLSGIYYVSIGKALPTGCIISIHKNDSTQFMITSPDTEVEINVTGNLTGRINIFVPKDTVINNVTIFPQISMQPNQPYVPYTMTNRELTDALTPVEGSFDYTHTASSTTPSPNTGRTHIFNVDKIAVASLWVSNCTISSGSWQEICRTTLKSKKETVFPLFMGNGRTDYGRIDTNGVITGYFQNPISDAEIHANFTYILP